MMLTMASRKKNSALVFILLLTIITTIMNYCSATVSNNLHCSPSSDSSSVICRKWRDSNKIDLQKALEETVKLNSFQLTALREIAMLDCEISEIGESFVKFDEPIEKLTVANCLNESGRIHPRAFSGLRNLKRLDLSGNHLKELPPAVGHLRKMREINLEDNKISFWPHEDSDLAKALEYTEVINLAFNHLGDIKFEKNQAAVTAQLLPVTAFSIGPARKSLTHLSLRTNKFKWFPEDLTISSFPNLRHLDLSFNELSSKYSVFLDFIMTG
jgi:Leucine-rich repeat (LRR) protein